MNLPVICLSILLLTFTQSYAVTGFTVAADGGDFSNSGYGGFGEIVRIDIVNSIPMTRTQLTTEKGGDSRISQDGTRVAYIAEDGNIVVISANDGSNRRVVGRANVSAKGIIAWVNNEYIYYSDGDGEGSKKIYKVSSEGGIPQQVVTFNTTVWTVGISRDGSRATVRRNGVLEGCPPNLSATVYRADFPGDITLVCDQDIVSSDACGNSISPSGEYVCYYTGASAHKIVYFQKWDGSSAGMVNTSLFYSSATVNAGKNNLTRWSTNSEDWLCLHYDFGKYQVLIKRDGTEWIKVNITGSRMPGDFWVEPASESLKQNKYDQEFKHAFNVIWDGDKQAGFENLQRADYSVDLMNASGKIVERTQPLSQNGLFTGLSKGVYVMRFGSTQQKKYKRIIIP